MENDPSGRLVGKPLNCHSRATSRDTGIWEMRAASTVGQLRPKPNGRAAGARVKWDDSQWLKAQNLQRPAAQAALYPRSVCWITTAFDGLGCHPLTCIALKIR
jgi:hypothetical protein